jgi:hypothetical protein
MRIKQRSENTLQRNDFVQTLGSFEHYCSRKWSKFDWRCSPWPVRTHHHPHLPRDPLQHNHLSQPDGSHKSGRCQQRSLPIFSSHQSQLLGRHPALPLLDVRARVHHPRTAVAAVSIALRVCSSVREADAQVRLSVAAELRVQQVSGGRRRRRTLRRSEPRPLRRSGVGEGSDDDPRAQEAVGLLRDDGLYLSGCVEDSSRSRVQIGE